ncbi:MAG: hypothetical protein ACHQ1H_05160 [Nitrososphaerales archaeon]
MDTDIASRLERYWDVKALGDAELLKQRKETLSALNDPNDILRQLKEWNLKLDPDGWLAIDI